MELRRRPATADDQELARQIHHRAYREVVERQFGHWDQAAQDAYFDRAWPQHGHDILEWGGSTCGYAAVEVGTDAVDVHELVLDPQYQSRGIGTLVLREAVDHARSLGLPVKLQALRQNGQGAACTNVLASDDAAPRRRTDRCVWTGDRWQPTRLGPVPFHVPDIAGSEFCLSSNGTYLKSASRWR